MLRRVGVAVLLTAVAAAIGLSIVVDRPAFRGWLIQGVIRRAAPGVAVGSATVELFPAPALVLRGVTFEAAAKDGGHLTARAPLVRCALRLWPLLGGRVSARWVSIEKPELAIPVTLDGVPALEDLLRPLEATDGRTVTPGVSATGGLPRISLRDATVTIGESDTNGEGFRLGGVDLVVEDSRSGPAGYTLTADARDLGRVALRGAFLPNIAGLLALGQRLTVDLIAADRPALVIDRAEDGRVGVRNIPPWLSRAAARGTTSADGPAILPRVVIQNGTVTFADHAVAAQPVTLQLSRMNLILEKPNPDEPSGFVLTASAGGRARVDVRGRVGPRRASEALSRLPFDATIKLEDLEATLAVPYVFARPSVGIAAGVLDIDASAAGPALRALRVNGTATLSAAGVDWSGVHVEGPILMKTDFAFGDQSLRLTEARVRAAGLRSGTFAAGNVTASFEYGDRRLRVERLRFDAFGGPWTHSGGLSLDGDVHLDGELRLTGVAYRRLLGALHGSEGVEDIDSVDIDARIEGTAAHPKVLPLSANVPPAAVRKVCEGLESLVKRVAE